MLMIGIFVVAKNVKNKKTVRPNVNSAKCPNSYDTNIPILSTSIINLIIKT